MDVFEEKQYAESWLGVSIGSLTNTVVLLNQVNMKARYFDYLKIYTKWRKYIKQWTNYAANFY